MGTLNPIGPAPTSTGETQSARTNSPAARVTSNASAANPILKDWVEIANVPALAQIEPLQIASPTQFQSVLTDAIRQLNEAESQTTDPQARAYLASLAERFKLLLQDAGVSDLSLSATNGR